MKYIKKIVILAVLLIAVSIHHAYAKTSSVTKDGVRVRKSPSTESEIVTVLNKGAEFEITDDAGDWYKIKYTWNGTYEGYVRKDLVKASGSQTTSTPTPTESPAPQQVATTTTQEPTVTPSQAPVEQTIEVSLGENVTGIEAKVYAVPTVSASIKDSVRSNSTIVIKEIAGKFVYIKYNDKYGWIKISTLKQKDQTTNNNVVNNSNSTTSVNTKKGYVKVTQAIVRSKATTSSEMLTSLNFNAEITIIGEENDFYKIKINGDEGYIAKHLISDSKQQTTSRSSSEARKTTEVQETKTEVKTQTTAQTTNKTSTENKATTTPKPQSENKKVPTSSVGEQMAQMAKTYVGYKYVYGGASPSTGFDCSGLVYYICGKLGYNVYRTADTQVNNGVYVEKSNLQPGDLVFFTNYKTNKDIGHVGIYIGDGQFVHASTPSVGVIISSLSEASYVKRYVTARRIGV